VRGDIRLSGCSAREAEGQEGDEFFHKGFQVDCAKDGP
jgi:hypothetical protein